LQSIFRWKGATVLLLTMYTSTASYYLYGLEQGFPTWGTCTPRGTFAYPKGYI